MEGALLIIAIIMFSAIVHEVMHGVAADKLGDSTARYAGRLTLNPLPHIDPFGSIVLPFITVFSTGFFFGWAKPVPYNPDNLIRAPYWGEAIIAAAGPASNLFLAIVFSIFVNLLPLSEIAQQQMFLASWTREGFAVASSTVEIMAIIFYMVININISLMILNLIPIPPLDGSKILSAILPLSLRMQYDRIRAQLEYNPFLGFGIVIVFILVFGGAFGSLVYSIARFIAGA